MTYYLKGKPIVPFVRPPGLEQKTICDKTGALPTKYCPTTTELFIPGTEPTAYDTLFQAFLIDRETGNLATASTPPDKVDEKVFEIYPPEAADYVQVAKVPQPPDPIRYQLWPAAECVWRCGYHRAKRLLIRSGHDGHHWQRKGGDFNHYRLDFGKGLNPTEWQQIGPDHSNQSDQGPLENWDVTTLDGLFSLRLTVFRKNGDTQTSIVPVTVDNISPTIKIVYPNSGDGYTYGQDEWVNLQLDVQDNVAIGMVQFFVDDKPDPWATAVAPPYGNKWLLDTPDKIGTHVFFARVYDRAGNVAESNKVKVFIGVAKKSP